MRKWPAGMPTMRHLREQRPKNICQAQQTAKIRRLFTGDIIKKVGSNTPVRTARIGPVPTDPVSKVGALVPLIRKNLLLTSHFMSGTVRIDELLSGPVETANGVTRHDDPVARSRTKEIDGTYRSTSGVAASRRGRCRPIRRGRCFGEAPGADCCRTLRRRRCS